MTTLAVTTLLADSDGWGHGAGWGMGGMMIGMVLFWGAIVLGIVWLARGGLEHQSQRPEATALSVLDRRFAEGALSPNDYLQRRSILTHAAPPHPDHGNESPSEEGMKP